MIYKRFVIERAGKCKRGPLAQWSELSAHNRLVRGSNP